VQLRPTPDAYSWHLQSKRSTRQSEFQKDWTLKGREQMQKRVAFQEGRRSEAEVKGSQPPQMDKGEPSLSYPDDTSTAHLLKGKGKGKPVLPQYTETVQTTASKGATI
jgi:hypothetical protein